MKNYRRFKEWFQQLAHDRNVGNQSLVQNSTQIEMREISAGATLVWQVSIYVYSIGMKQDEMCDTTACDTPTLFLGS